MDQNEFVKRESNSGCKFVCAGRLLAAETTVFCMPKAKVSTCGTNIAVNHFRREFVLLRF